MFGSAAKRPVSDERMERDKVKVFDAFKKRDRDDMTEKEKKSVDIKELEIYSGMRVAVETPERELLFLANLQDPYKGTAKLCQCSSEGAASDEELLQASGPMRVKLRGYNDRKRKAVFMEGMITPGPKHRWQIEELTVTKVENERTFYRLNTDMDAVIAAAEGGTAGERRCRLLNISEGGASISAEYPYRKGDRFLLKVRLLEKESEVVLYCEVLRVAEKSGSRFEYGCHFLDLTKADEEQLAQSIWAAGHKEGESFNSSGKEEDDGND